MRMNLATHVQTVVTMNIMDTLALFPYLMLGNVYRLDLYLWRPGRDIKKEERNEKKGIEV